MNSCDLHVDSYGINADFVSSILSKFKNVKILCIGDIMLDTFVSGEVNRISPEAPVPILKKKDEISMLGGVGNVARNLSTLGGNVSLFACVGDDFAGREIKRLLDEQNIKGYLYNKDDALTIKKTRFVSSASHLLRLDEENTLELKESELSNIKSELSKIIPEHDVIILSDYNKGFVSKELSSFVISKASEFAKKVIVDPKGVDYTKYAGAYIVKPNKSEFEQISGVKINPNTASFIDELKEGAQVIFANSAIKNLIVTLGENGMVFVPSSLDEIQLFTSPECKVYDVSGAGDTAVSMISLCMAVGCDIKSTIKLANVASSIVVAKVSTAVVTVEEILSFFNFHSKTRNSSFRKKIYDLNTLLCMVEKLKKEGLSIGFTNGCFDLVHSGHLFSLYESKKECDFLIIGVNTDESVKRLKGESRPIQTLSIREDVLSSLEPVDAVIAFDENTALELVQKIKPDIIAKEGYDEKDWPEGRFVKENGGRVVSLKRLDGYSTSEILSKINSK